MTIFEHLEAYASEESDIDHIDNDTSIQVLAGDQLGLELMIEDLEKRTRLDLPAHKVNLEGTVKDFLDLLVEEGYENVR